MELWNTRHHSIEEIEMNFKQEGLIIEKSFEIVDECIDLFNTKARENDFHRVCGLALAKARNYALGMYGLILDGLAQESGALLRAFIEYYESLIYFRLDPNRVQEAIENNLPSAGKIAKVIEGSFQEIRKHLNNHASHRSFSEHSLNHLINKTDMAIKKEQHLQNKKRYE